ncbi:MAG: hypothetical protein LH606_13420, partial [Cytophagaceae bacterium]|nr:hypothetical protein [Cytophagaceae bacterium]
YRAALTLRGYVRPQDALGASNLADKLLLFAYARFNRLDELMGKLSESMKKRIVDYPNLLLTSQRQSILSNLSFANIVGTESLFMLGEWLAKVRTLHQTRRYNETVLAMAVFYEAYLAASIQHQFGYQLVDDGKRQDEVNRLLNDARRRFPTIASAYTDEKQRLSNDVPFQIIICRQIQYPDHQKFLALLDPWIARGKDKGAQLFQGRSVVGINTIRNKVAHNGRFILDEEWTSVLGYLDGFLLECYTLFGLPDSDPYAELNEAIVKQF